MNTALLCFPRTCKLGHTLSRFTGQQLCWWPMVEASPSEAGRGEKAAGTSSLRNSSWWLSDRGNLSRSSSVKAVCAEECTWLSIFFWWAQLCSWRRVAPALERASGTAHGGGALELHGDTKGAIITVLSDVSFPLICSHTTVAIRKTDPPLPCAPSILSQHLRARHYHLNHSTLPTPSGWQTQFPKRLIEQKEQAAYSTGLCKMRQGWEEKPWNQGPTLPEQSPENTHSLSLSLSGLVSSTAYYLPQEKYFLYSHPHSYQQHIQQNHHKKNEMCACMKKIPPFIYFIWF